MNDLFIFRNLSILWNTLYFGCYYLFLPFHKHDINIIKCSDKIGLPHGPLGFWQESREGMDPNIIFKGQIWKKYQYKQNLHCGPMFMNGLPDIFFNRKFMKCTTKAYPYVLLKNPMFKFDIMMFIIAHRWSWKCVCLPL